jgi:hypothetical protein
MIKISRKNFAEYLILALYTHTSLQEICHGDEMYVPDDKYADFVNDFNIIIGQLLRHVAKHEQDEE